MLEEMVGRSPGTVGDADLHDRWLDYADMREAGFWVFPSKASLATVMPAAKGAGLVSLEKTLSWLHNKGFKPSR
jgi:hypothetical protein